MMTQEVSSACFNLSYKVIGCGFVGIVRLCLDLGACVKWKVPSPRSGPARTNMSSRWSCLCGSHWMLLRTCYWDSSCLLLVSNWVGLEGPFTSWVTLVALGQKFSELPHCIVTCSVDVHFLLMRNFLHCAAQRHFLLHFSWCSSTRWRGEFSCGNDLTTGWCCWAAETERKRPKMKNIMLMFSTTFHLEILNHLFSRDSLS